MKYESVCAGIEAFSQATKGLDYQPVSFSEIDPAANAVLAHHYKNVPNRGDFSVEENDYDPIDLLVGGTPCQDFSVAGLRAGMDGARGQLTVEFAKLAGRKRPRWILWENVPGVLSIDEGRAFGTFLGLLGKFGYGFAYRVLDAQHFGVPQRRRRVFVVGYLGDWRRAAAVLFERHSLSGHPPPRREAGKRIARSLSARTEGGGGLGTDFECAGGVVEVAACLDASYGRLQGASGQDVNHGHSHLVIHSLRAEGFDASEDDGSHANVGGQVAVAYRTAGDGAVYEEGGQTAPLTTSTDPNTQILTLAIRGRDGEATLEVRDDGTANAILTPNGGRGGIGVGAVAIQNATRGQDQNGLGVSDDGTMYTLDQGSQHAVAISANQRGELRERPVHGRLSASKSGKQFDGVMVPAIGWSEELTASVDLAGTIQRGGNGGRHEGVMTPSMTVRRLTPRECERLQGFEDDYTLIRYHKVLKSGKLSKRLYVMADGPRYKMLGNSMAVPVIRWIAKRILEVDAIPLK